MTDDTTSSLKTSGVSRPGFLLAMFLPGGLVSFVLILFALGLVVFLGFRVNGGSLIGDGFTWANFYSVATDPLYVTVTLRSLAIAGLVTIVTVVAAYPIAYYLSFHAGRHLIESYGYGAVTSTSFAAVPKETLDKLQLPANPDEMLKTTIFTGPMKQNDDLAKMFEKIKAGG